VHEKVNQNRYYDYKHYGAYGFQHLYNGNTRRDDHEQKKPADHGVTVKVSDDKYQNYICDQKHYLGARVHSVNERTRGIVLPEGDVTSHNFFSIGLFCFFSAKKRSFCREFL